MTPYEFTEINRKYGFQAMFNSKLKAVPKEEYEKKINEQWKQMFENDVKKEQEEIEKKLRKKQNANLRKLKKAVQNKKEVDEFVKKLLKGEKQ